MKTFRMRPYYLAPLMVLAMVACAKRDTDFAKKAAEKKAAAEAAKAGAGQTKPDANKPGTKGDTVTVPDASRGGSPSSDKNTPKESPKNSDGTPSATGKDPLQELADRKGKENKDAKPTEYKGDAVTTESCDNPISMKIDEEKEEKLKLSDIATDEEGTYILDSTLFFIEKNVESEKAIQLSTIGLPLSLPEGKNDVTDNAHINPTCNTVKESSQKISGDYTLPADISKKDGSVKNFRLDKVAVNAPEKVDVESKIYKNPHSKYGLKNILALDSENVKVIVSKAKDAKSFTLKMQIKETHDAETVTKTYQGTYSLKK